MIKKIVKKNSFSRFISLNESVLTLKEDTLSAVLHILGIILGIVSLVIGIQSALKTSSAITMLALVVYSLSLIILYSASTLYHAVQNLKWKKRLQFFDHVSIYLLIAGSYTPFFLLVIPGKFSYILLVFIWSMVLIGIYIRIFKNTLFKKYSTLSYIVMGWVALLGINKLMKTLPNEAFLLMLLTGFIYTFGVFFYVQNIKYFHAIWHLFVLAGSFVTSLFFFLYLI